MHDTVVYEKLACHGGRANTTPRRPITRLCNLHNIAHPEEKRHNSKYL